MLLGKSPIVCTIRPDPTLQSNVANIPEICPAAAEALWLLGLGSSNQGNRAMDLEDWGLGLWDFKTPTP